MSIIQSPPSQAQQDQLMPQVIQILTDSAVFELVQRINKDYLYWDKMKYLCPPNIVPEALWTAVCVVRNANRRWLRFGNLSVSYSLTDSMMQLLHLFDLNIGGLFGTKSLIPDKDKNYYIVSSIMEEAIASSQMEGASTTRKVAKNMLRASQKPKNKSQQMIVNNYQTIQYLSAHREDAFSLERLMNIHHLITEKTLDNSEDEGCFRLKDDIVVQDGITGEVAHVPPHVEDMEAMLEDLCRFANEDSVDNFTHPIIKAIIIHFMLAYIHPFVDGNGRTARSLFYWYMLQKGYHLMEYLSISRVIYRSKKSYEKSFLQTEADGLDMSYFILYNLSAMNQAFDELRGYLQRKVAERNDTTRYLQIGHINERQASLLQTYGKQPNKIILAKEIATRFSVSIVTARSDLQGLVKIGLFKEIPLDGKTTAYMVVDDCDQRVDALMQQR